MQAVRWRKGTFQLVSTARFLSLVAILLAPSCASGAPVWTGTEPIQSAKCPGFAAVSAIQETDASCWAACAEMIHRYYGRDIRQEEIVDRIVSDGAGREGASRAASRREIMLALNPDIPIRRYGTEMWSKMKATNNVTVNLNPGWLISKWLLEATIGPDDVVAEILKQRPVVLGLRPNDGEASGHVVVAYQVDFKRSGQHVQIVRVRVIDPANGMERVLTAQDVDRYVDFIMSQPLAREILRAEYASIGFQ